MTEEADLNSSKEHSGSVLGMMESIVIIYHKSVHKKWEVVEAHSSAVIFGNFSGQW